MEACLAESLELPRYDCAELLVGNSHDGKHPQVVTRGFGGSESTATGLVDISHGRSCSVVMVLLRFGGCGSDQAESQAEVQAR